MLLNRLFSSVIRCSNHFKNASATTLNKMPTIQPLSLTLQSHPYSTTLLTNTTQPPTLLKNPTILQLSQEINERSVTKFTIRKGKRRSVAAVNMRFYRLAWGAWIRTIAGRQSKIWKKSARNVRRAKWHVLCNGRQSWLLDKMAGPYWRKRRWYVEDPYEPYHEREEHPQTYRKPRPFVPKEEREC